MSEDDADDTRLWRAFVVDEFGEESWDDYLRQTSRADDGRDVVGE